MAERNCSGTSQALSRCEEARLRRRRELEDTPMSRVTAPREDASGRSCCLCRAGELAELLEEQNRLLCDILGAVTSLTAAQLAAGQLRRN